MTRQKEVWIKCGKRSADNWEASLCSHIQTRTRGTIGGVSVFRSICRASAIASLYGAELKIANADGERTVSMDDWALAYMTPNISPEDVR